MKLGWVLMSVIALSVSSFGCDRNSDQMSSGSQAQTDTGKAQNYPSTRNGENPNASVGGSNSATTRPGNQTPGTPANPPASGS